MTASSLLDTKSRLREEGFARRDALDPAWRSDASKAIAEAVLALPELHDIEPIGGYWPMRSEVDPRPVLLAVASRGHAIALPQTRMPLLVWRRWRPGDRLIPGGFGVMEPGPQAEEMSPRALIVPLCLFDRTGARLGYGKGHFDRSIAALETLGPLVTIGVAFSAQEADDVPMQAHDRRLDVIVTEREIIRAA